MRYKTRIYNSFGIFEFYIISSFERIFDLLLQNVDKMIKSCEIPTIVSGETFSHTIRIINHIPCYLRKYSNNALTRPALYGRIYRIIDRPEGG